MIAAYDAPFPDDTYKAGARIFPSLVPTGADDPAHDDQMAAWQVLEHVRQAVAVHVQRRRPDHRRAATDAFLRSVPGCDGQPHVTIEGGGHFLQEDKGPELAAIIADFIATT